MSTNAPTEGCDQDAANRPIREAARRWGLLRGIGLSQHWVPPGTGHSGLWHLGLKLPEQDEIEVRVTEAGYAWVEGEAGSAASALGMTKLLNRIEKERARVRRK